MSISQTDKIRVLIVEDEPEIRSFLYDLLEEDYACTAVDSAEAALALLSTTSFELILSDIILGGMTGLEMVSQVIGIAPETVIIMMSGQKTIEIAIEAMRAGAFDYVMKPFDLEQIEFAVERAASQHHLLAAKRRYEAELELKVAQRTAELNGALESVEEAYRATLNALVSALETRDRETGGHSERVVTFSLRLGRELGLSREELRSLEYGALLHDIGKIGVPDAILHKPARLTEEEWVEMRKHPAHGRQILSDIDFLDGASRVVSEHHEQWNGSGYPLKLRGEEIDIKARIFAVVDAFDAMISDRVYRKGMSYEEARAELHRCAGTQFDPQVVEAFDRVPKAEWMELKTVSLAGTRTSQTSLPLPLVETSLMPAHSL